jgi:hypothetical protein
MTAVANVGFIVATALAASACSGINDATLAMQVGMTEAQVEAVLDGPPKQADLSTCGTATAKPWTCKGWTYVRGGFARWDHLRLLFSRDQDGTWRLNSWHAWEVPA